jgi:hypothetical protein
MKQVKTIKNVILISIFLLTFLLSGCNKKDPLLATWQDANSGISMQFKDDGKLTISNQKTSLTVDYEKQDPNIVVVKPSADGSYPGQTMLYRIEEDRLILTLNNVDSVFVLVK